MPSFKDFQEWYRQAQAAAERGMDAAPTPRWMRGRYGADELGRFLVVAALVLFLVSIVPVLRPLVLVGIALIAVAIWRMLSKDVRARRLANERYLRVTRHRGGGRQGGRRGRRGGKADAGAAHVVNAWSEREGSKEFVYLTCDACGQRVRVPRGKGQVRVVCPTCKHEFYAHT